MLVLGLNTAFTAMEAAIVRDGEILADARETMARGQDKALPGFVERLLEEAGVTLGALAQFNLAGSSYADDVCGTCGVFGHHSKTCYYSRDATYSQHCDRDDHFYSSCKILFFDQTNFPIFIP